MLKRAATLATVAAVAVLSWGAAPAFADTPGFTTRITQAPDTFTIGQSAHTVEAVVSTDRDGRRCQKVRWALVISTQGVSLDQVRVNRIEGGQVVAVRTQVGADDARVADVALDTGQLCKGQTDTADWQISFTGPDDGAVTFSARALSQNGKLLATGEATSRVVTPVAAKPSPSASATASASATPTSTFSAQPTQPPQKAGLVASSAPALAAAASSGSSVLHVGLIVGAVLVLLGIVLLLRLRSRSRQKPPAWAAETQNLPTGFYDYPSHRSR